MGKNVISNILKTITSTLGVSSETVALALFASFVFIITLLISRYKYNRMVSEVAEKTSNVSTWRVAPTTISPPPSTSSTNISKSTNINTLTQMASATNVAPITSLAQPTDIGLPNAIIKQLQGIVANAGKLKALFAKIDKLDTIVSDIGKLEDLTAKIDRLEVVVARIEKLQLLLSPSQYDSAPQSAAPSKSIQTQPLPSKPVLPQVSHDESINREILLVEDNDLPKDLRGFFEMIITKRVWEESEIRDAALKNGLMHNIANDMLNEWADKKYGDSLVTEEGRQFIVHRDIFKPDEDSDA